MKGIFDSKIGNKIGLMGGTFDPLHNGHLAVALEASKLLGLDSIVFIPSARPPHKPNYVISPFESRVAMLQAALREIPSASLCQIENERSGPSYTIDTLKLLKNIHGDNQYYFIIGADAFAEIFTWKSFILLTEIVNLLVVNRPDCLIPPEEVIRKYFPEFSFDTGNNSWCCANQPGRIFIFNMEPIEISSTIIRQRIQSGKGVSGLVPPVVEKYIIEQDLYTG